VSSSAGSVGRQHILGIFQGSEGLVETMHYGVYGTVKCEKLLAVPSANKLIDSD